VSQPVTVWFVASEVAPYAKTGGLADVAGSLPDDLRGVGVNVSVALPFYKTVKDKGITAKPILENLPVPVAGRTLPCNVWQTEAGTGGSVFLFDNPEFFDRPDLYGTAQGDYPDNLERFTFLNRAVLALAKATGTHVDVLHCHDWQAALIPAYLKTIYAGDPFFYRIASLFTIHNMGYQGIFPARGLAVCGLPDSEFHMEGIEYWGGLSLLKAGIVYSDALTTVSPTYSLEIQTPEFGLGMDGILRRRSDRLFGILNGADYGVWNPATDVHIPSRYTAEDRTGKRACKAVLIHEAGLDERLLDRPVCGVISRLTVQKGYELIMDAVEEILQFDVGLVILGAGEEKYERAMAALGEKYPAQVGVWLGFDEPLAHRIMAGSDTLLVPSLYEPCGLTQLHAMKYGTVPIVRGTGGLEDTIVAFDPETGSGTGFTFYGHDSADFVSEIHRAIKLYEDASMWGKIVDNCMAADFSWERSARRYLDLYEELSARKRHGV
jgi:starch synthase